LNITTQLDAVSVAVATTAGTGLSAGVADMNISVGLKSSTSSNVRSLTVSDVHLEATCVYCQVISDQQVATPGEYIRNSMLDNSYKAERIIQKTNFTATTQTC
jgi:hypothetical protein